MVVYETVALMLVASAIGYALGAALVLYLGHNGLDLSSLFKDYSAVPGLTGMAYPRFELSSVAGPGIALFIASLAVSLFPALRAARLDPSRAIHQS
jgi:ABC-type antimicrobial peptide transport system permease subunit